MALRLLLPAALVLLLAIAAWNWGGLGGHSARERVAVQRDLPDGTGGGHAAALQIPVLEPCRVRVEDEEGAPIEGAILSVFAGSDDPPRVVVVTGPDGWVRFDSAKGDEALVEARGHADRVTDEFDAPIVLSPGGAVAGVVVDPGGNALAHADIEYEVGRTRIMTTDERGAFRLEGLELYPLEFHVSAEGYATAEVEANPGDEEVRVVMQRHGALRGSVLFPDGTPAPRARVCDIHANRAVSCDDAGRFLLEGLPPGPRTFNVTAERQPKGGALCSEATLEIGGGATAEKDFTLEERRFSHLWLRVLDVDGLPAKNWHAQIGFGTRRHSIATDASGEAAAGCDVPPGTEVATLASSDPKRGLPTSPMPLVTTTDALSRPQTVRLVPAPTFEIVAQESGGGALPADRRVRIMVGAELSQVSVSHDRARFAFDPCGVMGFLFAIEGPGYVRHWEELKRAPVAGERVEVRLARGGSASGRVARADRNGLTVAAKCIGERPCWVRVDVTGDAFEIPGIPPGPFLLYVKAGRLPQECAGSYAVRADENLDLGTVAVPPPRWVQGRVLGGNGRGLGGAEIEVHDGIEGSPEEGATYYTSADGSFRVPATSSGTPLLLLRKRGFATRGVRLRGNESPVVTMEPGATLALRILHPPTEDAAVMVAVKDPVTGIAWLPRREGRLERTYADLAPGPATILVTVGREQHAITAEVLADGSGVATLDLRR